MKLNHKNTVYLVFNHLKILLLYVGGIVVVDMVIWDSRRLWSDQKYTTIHQIKHNHELIDKLISKAFDISSSTKLSDWMQYLETLLDYPLTNKSMHSNCPILILVKIAPLITILFIQSSSET
jgi:hypothetical protein